MAKKEINFKEERSTLSPVSKNNPTTVNPEVFYAGLQESYGYFTPENAPKDYEGLNRELQVLSESFALNALILGSRLKVMRDLELYKEGKYEDLQSYIEGELKVSRRTAYNYLDIMVAYDEQVKKHVQDLAHVKLYNLIQSLPLVKKHPELTDKIFQASQTLKNKEFQEYLRSFKLQDMVNSMREESSEEITAWASSLKDLISQSKVIRDGMKSNTVKRNAKDFINWLLLNDPKNRTLQKIRDLWTDV